MNLTTSVDRQASVACPDHGPSWLHSFPSTQMVGTAAAMFTRHKQPERVRVLPSVAKAREYGYRIPLDVMYADAHLEEVEGPRWRVEVSPGAVAVRQTDPVRADRAAARVERSRRAVVDGMARTLVGGGNLPAEPPAGRGVVRVWSRKSRSRMVETLATLDWSPLFESGHIPAMITLTYPGDWLTVASDSAVCTRHVDLLRKRFRRAWGRPLVGAWKREFQQRGAPHYHVLMVPPRGTANGLRFGEWLSKEWASIVGHPDPIERKNHITAGTGIDYADGIRARDPKRIGVYFSKHGSFADKEYQNHAPEAWTGSVGRFWGYWGLRPAIAAVEVAPVEGQAIARTLRRYSRANAYTARLPQWRYRTVVDPDTGEVSARWRRSSKLQRVYRVRGSSGFISSNDGPALAASVARHVEQLRRPERIISRSGAGPVGFLP